MKTNGVRKPKKRLKPMATLLLIAILALALAVILFIGSSQQKAQFDTDPAESSVASDSPSNEDDKSEPDILTTASKSDWELVLVNLNNPKPEMNPELVTLENIQVDSRIVQNATDFLAAAKQINPAVHLISGYRSVAYQGEIFTGYIQQTLAENPDWTEDQARAQVMRTSQPPESSEHQTGLAIDLSTVDQLNAQDPAIATAIAEIAPDYGFVLRFPSWGTESTGIDYEDWHFRYVGVENAKYMTEKQLTLENFLDQLPNE